MRILNMLSRLILFSAGRLSLSLPLATSPMSLGISIPIGAMLDVFVMCREFMSKTKTSIQTAREALAHQSQEMNHHTPDGHALKMPASRCHSHAYQSEHV